MNKNLKLTACNITHILYFDYYEENICLIIITHGFQTCYKYINNIVGLLNNSLEKQPKVSRHQGRAGK